MSYCNRAQYDRARALWGPWHPGTLRLKEYAIIEELDETMDYLQKRSNKPLPLLDLDDNLPLLDLDDKEFHVFPLDDVEFV